MQITIILARLMRKGLSMLRPDATSINIDINPKQNILKFEGNISMSATRYFLKVIPPLQYLYIYIQLQPIFTIYIIGIIIIYIMRL